MSKAETQLAPEHEIPALRRLPRTRALLGYAVAHPARALGVLYAGFALLYFGAALVHGVSRGRLIAGDALFYYAYLPSLIVDHDVDLTNDLEILRGNAPEALKWQRTVTGKASSPYALGTAILAMPLVVVGFALDSLIAGRTDGYGWLAQASMCLAGMLQSWLGAVLLVRMLRRWFDPATALVTTLAAVLATSLVYYTLVSPTYAHASSFFAVTAFLSVWLATRDRLLPRGAALLGLAGGLMAMVRWQEVLFGLIPALALVARFTAARTNPAERRRIATFVAIALAAAALAFSPQTWVWHEIYGKWLTIPQGDTWVRWTRPDVAAALFSLDDGGLFTWTPFTLFGIVGLAWFRRREPGLTLALALVFALQVYVEGTVHHGLGSSYGSRRLIGATAIFAVGFAALSDELRARRRGWMALVLSSVLVGWNGLLLVEYQWLVHSPGRHGPYPTLRELVTHTPFRR